MSILLEGIGYRAGDVGTVVLSHLHGDHIGGLRELSHVELLVSRVEWHTLSGPWPEAAGVLRRPIRLPGLRWRQIEPAPIHDPSLAPFDTAMLNQLRETHPGLVVLATHDPGAAAALAEAETA